MAAEGKVMDASHASDRNPTTTGRHTGESGEVMMGSWTSCGHLGTPVPA